MDLLISYSWGHYSRAKREIIKQLAADIDQKVDLSEPDLLLWVDVIGNRTAFFMVLPHAD